MRTIERRYGRDGWARFILDLERLREDGFRAPSGMDQLDEGNPDAFVCVRLFRPSDGSIACLEYDETREKNEVTS